MRRKKEDQKAESRTQRAVDLLPADAVPDCDKKVTPERARIAHRRSSDGMKQPAGSTIFGKGAGWDGAITGGKCWRNENVYREGE